MRLLNNLINSRLLWAVLVPVIAMGTLVSLFALTRLTPPLAVSLQSQTDRALYHTADMALTILEERFGDLLELRLENDPEMQVAYLQEAVNQIEATHQLHKGVQTLILQNNTRFLGTHKTTPPLFDTNDLQGSMGKINEASYDGKPIRLLTQYFPYWNLHIVALISEADYKAPVIQARKIVIFGTFGVLLTVLLTLALLLVWRINKPLNKIIEATKKVATGDLIKTEITGADEIAQVGRAFNTMVDSLNEDRQEIKNILAELKNSEEQYRILTENTLAFIAVVQKRRCPFVNTRMLDSLGFNKTFFLDNDFSEIIHPDERRILEEMLSSIEAGSVHQNHIECRLLTEEKDLLWVELQANQILYRGKSAVLMHGFDISLRKEEQKKRESLEEQLNQAKKMEAIGTLAGGVAHDFNNMLGGIMGAAEMLGLYLPSEPKAQKFHKMILESAHRAADLTSKLLAFARNNPQASTPVDVHDIIKETATLLKNTIDKRIELAISLEAERSIIIGDATGLQNIILNICINSSHAMPDGGTISIDSITTELDAPYCNASTFDILPGEYIELEIRDTGDGIPAELLNKIFDPFFTTKEQGEGTGLGLASAYGTVQQHHGALSVYSDLGSGTTFHILLPLALAEEKVKKVTPILKKGSGTLLVVDDEDVMRVTAKTILEDLGYKVILAANGQEAATIFEQQSEEIDLVLLDMVMPVMNGRDCFTQLKQHDPDVRVVLSSGFTREEDLQEMKLWGLKGFIRKPYRSTSLSQVVHEVLG